MDGAKEDLVDMFIVHTTEEIQVSGTQRRCADIIFTQQQNIITWFGMVEYNLILKSLNKDVTILLRTKIL